VILRGVGAPDGGGARAGPIARPSRREAKSIRVMDFASRRLTERWGRS